MGDLITFNQLITKVLEESETALEKCNFRRARECYTKMYNLYQQHPTGNHDIEKRAYDLHSKLYENK